MICPKCRVNIADGDKYCPRCGEVFDHSDLERLGNKLENNLLNIYSNKIWGRLNISVGYLLFNFWYALYKKMYYEAIIGGVSVGVFFYLIFNGWNLFLESLGFNALLLIYLFSVSVFINIYYIFKFDDLYLTRAKGYISKIINEHGTSDVDLLTKLCKKDSKGNLFVAILPIILVIAFFVYLLFIH